MLQLARGKPEQQFGDTVIAAREPDWRQVEDIALRLLSQSKDLRIMLTLVRSWTAQRALEGYAEGLSLIARALERYWESLLPELRQAGEHDPFIRINALRELGDGFELARLLRRSPFLRIDGCGLTVSETLQGLEGNGDTAGKYAGGPARLLQEVRQGTSPQARHIPQAIAAAERIGDLLRSRLGESALPEMSQLLAALRSLAPQCPPPGETEVGPAAIQAAMSCQPGPAVSEGRYGDITSRAEAGQALEQVKQYFTRFEPGHPAPLLITRIEQLMGRDFMGIIDNLAPSAVAQFEQVLGAKGHS